MIEYVHGGSLKTGLQKLQRDISATERFRAAVALQAARGKTAMHGHVKVIRCHLLMCACIEKHCLTCGVALMWSETFSALPHRPRLHLRILCEQDLPVCCEKQSRSCAILPLQAWSTCTAGMWYTLT